MPCGRNSRAYSIGLFSALGGLLFGYHTGVISGVLVMNDFRGRMHINISFDSSASEKQHANAIAGGIVGVLLSGCFLGSLLGGQASDRFSRKYSISFFSAIFTVAAGLQTWSPAYPLLSLLIARFFTGKNILDFLSSA